MNTQKLSYLVSLFILLIVACAEPGKIDRKALVTRHNPVMSAIDSLDVLSVGNGNFTVDATGLQTFPEYYKKGIPLGTQSNWAWHSFPNQEGYNLAMVSKKFASCKDSILALWLSNCPEMA